MIQVAETTKRYGRFTKWQPKTWKPLHQTIVQFHCNNVKNKDIARLVRKTPEFVSMVLTTDKAVEIKQEFLAKMHEKLMHDIPSMMEDISKLTVRRIRESLENDEIFKNSPLGIIDRGIKIMEGIGKIKTKAAVEANVNVTDNSQKTTLLFSDKNQERILEALEKSNVVRRIHALPVHEGLKSGNGETRSGTNGRDVGEST